MRKGNPSKKSLGEITLMTSCEEQKPHKIHPTRGQLNTQEGYRSSCSLPMAKSTLQHIRTTTSPAGQPGKQRTHEKQFNCLRAALPQPARALHTLRKALNEVAHLPLYPLTSNAQPALSSSTFLPLLLLPTTNYVPLGSF